MSQKAFGNVAAEYVIGGILVGVVSIAGLGLLSGSVGNVLSTVQSDAKKHADAADQALSNGPVVVTAIPTGANQPEQKGIGTNNTGDGNSGNIGAQSLQLSSGQQLFLDTPPIDASQMLETSGANGTTLALANQLEVLANQLLAADMISEAEANQFKDVANQGYKLADVQQFALGRLNDPNSSFTYDGVKYENLDDLADSVGLSAPNNSNGSDGAAQVPGVQLQKFMDLLSKVQKMPIMKESSVNTLVNGLSGQIMDISKSVENTLTFTHYPGGVEIANEKISQDFVQTSDNSGKICSTGGGSGSGLTCN